MTSCEKFESNYEAWQEQHLNDDDDRAMHAHASTCLHCAEFGRDGYRLRSLVSSVPNYMPSSGFEASLNRRIADLKVGNTPRRKTRRALIPSWAAMGAGLATGLAIGIALLIPHETFDLPTSQFADNISESHILKDVQTTYAAVNDSTSDTTAVTDPLYNLDRHSQTVSSGQ